MTFPDTFVSPKGMDIVITRHGRPAGVLIGFESEEDWFDTNWSVIPNFFGESQERAATFAMASA